MMVKHAPSIPYLMTCSMRGCLLHAIFRVLRSLSRLLSLLMYCTTAPTLLLPNYLTRLSLLTLLMPPLLASLAGLKSAHITLLTFSLT